MSNEFWAKESRQIRRQMPDLARIFARHPLGHVQPENHGSNLAPGGCDANLILVPPPRVELGTY